MDQERFFESYPFPVPGRERLLREGISFVHHENNSNICSSSRSVIYTGLHMPPTGDFQALKDVRWSPAGTERSDAPPSGAATTPR